MSSSGLSDATVIALAQEALMTTLMIAAPILIVSLVIGVTISIFQAMTQVNEVTLTFVPKIFGVFAVAALLGPWMIGTMVAYTTRLFSTLPTIAQ
jgi:flagellar biosynthesis protein FliQ